ncbi:MAG: cysteine desulfurase family protein [Chitinophagales bacterium]
MKVYFDNAATTPIDSAVLEEMMPFLTDHFGNPSSIHSFGRKTRAAIEKARKQVAQVINAAPGEIFFTSCGTESNNTIIRNAVRDMGVQRIISSEIEHHCVLHALEREEKGDTEIQFVRIDRLGVVDFDHLQELLRGSQKKTMVSLMHANNEIGTLLDLQRVADLCAQHQAIFHTDTVQSLGFYPIDVQKTKIHFLTGSAHKFHGPKGIGFFYMSPESHIGALLEGGAQERNMRAGTENIYGIVGLGKALSLAAAARESTQQHITQLRQHMITLLKRDIPGIAFNSFEDDRCHYKVLSVSLPPSEKSDLVIFNLDIAGVAASGGSACSSGSEVGSHVLKGIGADAKRKAVRFSFSRHNTIEEVEYAVKILKESIQ